jgi:hypothetical protein
LLTAVAYGAIPDGGMARVGEAAEVTALHRSTCYRSHIFTF